jgi:protein phosphatase
VANTLSGALEIALQTDPGLVRGHNEDAVFADAARGLAILADGMGGYSAGEVASSMATKLLSARLEAAFKSVPAYTRDSRTGQPFARNCLVEQIAAVNSAIYRAAESQMQFIGMGTTLVAVVFCDNKLVVAHVGDSRLYCLRSGNFAAMTRDHSLLQEQIDSGLISVEEARHSTNKNLVTRAVGVDPEVDVEIHLHPVQPGDLYLLCSDGLYDMVDDLEIHRTLEAFGSNPDLAARQLIRTANDNGGEDNVSVVVIKVLHDFPAGSACWWKPWSWFR